MIVMSFASRPSRRSLLAALGLGAGGPFLSACGGGSSGDGDSISVVTSAYPLAFLLERIGGDRIALTDLSTPGADAHGLELSVKQVLAIERADLVLQIPASRPLWTTRSPPTRARTCWTSPRWSPSCPSMPRSNTRSTRATPR